MVLVMVLVMSVSAAFAGTYKGQKLDSDFGKSIAFNEMSSGTCKTVQVVTDDLWGGFGNKLVERALAANEGFKDGLITNYTKINGTDDSITVVEVHGGKVVSAVIYVF